MRINLKLLYTLSFLVIWISAVAAPDALMSRGKESLSEYHRLVSAGNPGLQAYSSAYNAFEAYYGAISSLTSESPGFQECRSALRELFPVMGDGAYYFANAGQQDKVLKYACAYIDISLLPAFAADNFHDSPAYPVLANLAATNVFNRGDYERATDYFKAYLSTSDMENRELAFEGLARCFYERKDYDGAAYIASQGSGYYPANWNMLIIGIESYGHVGNDTKMEPLLNRALSMSPGHKGLMEYQGKMFERQKRFDDAAAVFAKLYAVNSMSLDYALHLGFNLYNSATATLHRAKAPGIDVDEAAVLDAGARARFAEAAPVLRDVFDNSPYAANVARALAMCYAMNNDGERLRKTNESLTALHVSPVAPSEIPMLDLSYRPTVELAPVDQSALAGNRPLSDVDINIPVTGHRSDKTYVVVIGNEKYKYHKDVPYANNDGKVFAEYCRKVFGVPEDNIRQCYDATLSEIREQVNYLQKRTEIEPGKLDVIFYYAGHGVPDVATGSAYLLPSDATGSDFESCFSLSGLYDRFDEMAAKNVTVFLDACFSGATRDNEMLFAERFVEYEVEDVVSKGNTVVFSATTGKQTAMGYDEQGHGFFTYYLLKNLQASGGNITLRELADNIQRNVEAKTLDKKNKRQSPQVKPSPALGDSWESRTLF